MCLHAKYIETLKKQFNKKKSGSFISHAIAHSYCFPVIYEVVWEGTSNNIINSYLQVFSNIYKPV